MSQRERMITQWKSLTITNKRIIQKKGFLFWKVYQDVMRRDITSIFTGRMPLFKVLGIGTLCTFLSVLGIFLMPEMFEEYSFICNYTLVASIIAVIVGAVGNQKTEFYFPGGKISETGYQPEFLKKLRN